MATVIIYSKSWCPFCTKAKMLLEQKGVVFEDIDVEKYPDKFQEMAERSHGRRTVPQIFINSQHIGGCDDLYALEAEGKLEDLLV